MASRPHIVVVGAGFGGLEAVKALRRVDVDITLIDANNYHLFTPLLYQVATGLLDPSEIAHPIRAILRRVKNLRVEMATVSRVHLAAQSIETSAGLIGYDVLVLAAGSVTDFFGNDSLRTRTFALKRLGEALALRAQVLNCFERAAVTADPAERRRLLTIAVVGAGPTGVEYSGAIAELINHVLPKDYRELDFAETAVVVVEAGSSALATFAPRLGRAAVRSLERRRVRFEFDARVSGVEDGVLVLSDGRRIPAATVVWTAGVQPASLAFDADIATDRGRVVVTESLHLPDHPEVFVIGDAAAARDRGNALPMVSPVAIQQGRHVAKVIKGRRDNRADPAFHYFDKGTMAVVGRGSAVAEIGPIRVSGFIAWLLWLFVHLVYLIGFRSRVIALASWAWNFFFYDRPVRLIVEPDQPRAG